MSSSIKHHDNTSFWDNRRGVIYSQIGGWIPGKAVYCHGYDMMEDLVGKVSYFQVLMLNATGRLPDQRLAEWMEAYFIGNSYPDARIWCNQIGSLAGTMHTSPLAATSAGILASDSKMYGPGTVMAGVSFFVEALAKKMGGLSAEEIVASQQRHPKAKPVIIGYARPIANGDERIVTLDLLAKKLGFERGEHLTLAFEIEQEIFKKTKERMNLLAYVLPFLCDQGYSPQEIYRLLSALVYAGVVACYGETADQPGESFFPLQCNDIYYQGKSTRKIPSNTDLRP